MPQPEHRPLDRRKFLRTTAAAALSAPSYAAIPGSNERLRIAFLGCGGRAQAHLHLITRWQREGLPVEAVGVCDVWDGHEDDYDQLVGGRAVRRHYAQGLYPAARTCGFDPHDTTRVTRDYRRLLDRKDVDVVVIATPDHWHARMAIDAAAAGKDIFCETPMTRTSAEAIAVLDAVQRHQRVMTVATPTLADPSWQRAREAIQAGRIGPLVHLSAGVYRNDARGQWRFYRLPPGLNSTTIDWDLFLGHRFEVGGVPLGPTPGAAPFDPVTFAQWRCDARFSGGPFTDLDIHPVTRLLAATGLRFPSRVIAASGLYHERDGRTVPDVATFIADFSEGCQMVITGSTATAYAQDDLIRGRLGAVRFVRGGIEVIRETPAGTDAAGSRSTTEPISVEPPKNETQALWTNFLECVRRRDRATLGPPDLGAAAVTLVALAQQSARDGVACRWDAERRTVRA